jgi:hypothetical protein
VSVVGEFLTRYWAAAIAVVPVIAFAHAHPREIRALKVHIAEISACHGVAVDRDVAIAVIDPDGAAPMAIRTAEDRIAERGTVQCAVTQIGSGEIAAAEVCVTEVRTGEVAADELYIA